MLFSQTVFAQENAASRFHFKSVGAGFGITAGDETAGGVAFMADVTTAVNKNLFSVALSSGNEVDLFEAERKFFAADIFYGREISITRIFKIEAFAGVGIFTESYKNGDTNFVEINETAVGLPVRIKFLFYVTNKFAIGINPNVNFNSIETLYSGNLQFQYNFGK